MTSLQRIRMVFESIMMLLFAGMLLLLEENSYKIIGLIISIGLIPR